MCVMFGKACRMTPRAPLRVAIAGSGFGGLGMGMTLARAGNRNFAIFERAASLGGTWRENTYPGAGCDVPSHLYSFSFHQRSWPRRYSGQADILQYLEELADAYGLRPGIRFGAEVVSASFEEGSRRWRVALAGGDEVTARAVVSSVGQLNRPVLPDISGRERFRGPAWHSARWEHDCPLDGRRI